MKILFLVFGMLFWPCFFVFVAYILVIKSSDFWGPKEVSTLLIGLVLGVLISIQKYRRWSGKKDLQKTMK